MVAGLFGLAYAAVSPPLAADIPPHLAAVPGGVTVVPLDTTGKRPPVAHFLNNRVMIQWHDKQWQAVVGIPLNLPPGEYPLHVQTSPDAIPQNFPVVVADKSFDVHSDGEIDTSSLAPAERQRLLQERRDVTLSMHQWQERIRVAMTFVAPVNGVITHTFGSRPVNMSRRGLPLDGVRIAAPAGTVVVAGAAGTVSKTSDYLLDGKTVFIDHGQGLVSMYSHLADVSVTTGQSVKQGDKIGTVGSTGKIDAPQLQWRISLNGVAVDPTLFVPDLEAFAQAPSP